MNTDDNFHKLWLDEQSYLDSLKSQNPELFIIENPPAYEAILNLVGIQPPQPNLPEGIIKHHPLDFIVEEISRTGQVCNTSFGNAVSITGEKAPFIEAVMVKAGVSTFDVIKDMAREFKISETKFSYAGIKDAKAVTSQKISFSGVPHEKISTRPVGNYFLKDLKYAAAPLGAGQLQGNRFTILVRTNGALDENSVSQNLENLQTNGFWNFYWTQRFGTRLHTHYWGLLALKNQTEKLVRSYLTESGPHDAPFFIQLREQANTMFGQWKEMKKLYAQFPFTMRYELRLLEHLQEYNSDFVGALRNIPDQVKFWMYAYASFLANQVISSYASDAGTSPERIPMLLTNNPKERELYAAHLKRDGIPLNFNTGRFDFIRLTSRQLDLKVKPVIHKYEFLPEGLAIEFDLPKGAYATTFLSHIFKLPFQNRQEWVQPRIYDLKKVLGYENMAETISALKIDSLDSAQDSDQE